MEQLPALSPVLCILLLLPIWAAAVAEIPANCQRPTPNGDASAQEPDALSISQQPRSLNTTAGENMTLSCTFPNTDGSRARVLWLRGSGEDMQLDSKHPFYRGRLRVSTLDENREGRATLSLAELELRDSGLYCCCVQIDNKTKRTGLGGGTELSVMRRNQSEAEDKKELIPDASPELTVYRAVVALAGVSIVILVTTLLLRRRTAAVPDTQQQPPAEGESRAGDDVSEGLHYGEITFQAPAHPEYASIQTWQL